MKSSLGAVLPLFLSLGIAQASQKVFPKINLQGQSLGVNQLCSTADEVRTLAAVPTCVEAINEDGVVVCVKFETRNFTAARILQIQKCVHSFDDDGVASCDRWAVANVDLGGSYAVRTVEKVDLGDGAGSFHTIGTEMFSVPSCH